jgi:hypothetical protein
VAVDPLGCGEARATGDHEIDDVLPRGLLAGDVDAIVVSAARVCAEAELQQAVSALG